MLVMKKISYDFLLSNFKIYIFLCFQKFSWQFSWNPPLTDSRHLSYRTLSAEFVNETLLLSVSIQFLLILEVIADRVTAPSRICRSIRQDLRYMTTLGMLFIFCYFISVTSSYMQLKSIVFISIKFLHSQTVT